MLEVVDQEECLGVPRHGPDLIGAAVVSDGASPREQLAAIRKRATELSDEAHKCFTKKILPRLDRAGIHVLDYAKLNKTQKERADDYFSEVIYPVTKAYHPAAERGVRWNDPRFGIEWPEIGPLLISPKDERWPDYQPDQT